MKIFDPKVKFDLNEINNGFVNNLEKNATALDNPKQSLRIQALEEIAKAADLFEESGNSAAALALTRTLKAFNKKQEDRKKFAQRALSFAANNIKVIGSCVANILRSDDFKMNAALVLNGINKLNSHLYPINKTAQIDTQNFERLLEESGKNFREVEDNDLEDNLELIGTSITDLSNRVYTSTGMDVTDSDMEEVKALAEVTKELRNHFEQMLNLTEQYITKQNSSNSFEDDLDARDKKKRKLIH